MFGSGDLGMGVTFSLRDNATAGAQAAGQSVTNLERVVNHASTTIQNAAARITSGIVATVTAVTLLMGPFAAAVDTSSEFNFQISRAGAVSRATAQEITMLKDKALELGNATMFNAIQIAKAEFVLSQAGFAVQQQMEILPPLIDLATAGVVSLEYAAGVATDTLYQFGLGTQDMTRVADVIVNAANMSMVSVENFGNAMKYLGPTAKLFGIELEEAAGYIELMANSGMRGSIGTRAFGTALLNLASPSKLASESMMALGFDAYDASGKFVGLTQMVRMLQSAVSGLTNKERDRHLGIIFGNEAIQEIVQLMTLEFTAIENGTEVVYRGADALEYFTQKNREAGGVAAEVSSAMRDNLHTDFKLLAASLETLRIKMGDILEGPLRPLVQNLRAFVQQVQGFLSTKFGQVLFLTAAAAAALFSAMIVLGFVFTILLPSVWAMVTAMGALMIELAPFIAIGLAIVGVIYMMKKAFDEFNEVMSNESAPATGFMGLLQRIGGVMAAVVEIWSTWNGETFTLSEQMHDALERIGILDFVLNLATWIVRAKELFNGFVEGLVMVYVIVEQTVGAVMESLGDLVDSLEDIGIPIKKLTGDLGIFKSIGTVLATFALISVLPLILLGQAIAFVSNAIEFLIVNFKELVALIPSLAASVATGNFGAFATALGATDFKNTFNKDGTVTQAVGEGSFDFGNIAARHAEIMAMLNAGNNPAPTTPGESPAGKPVENYILQTILDGEKIAEEVLNKEQLKNGRR